VKHGVTVNNLLPGSHETDPAQTHAPIRI